MASLTDLGGIVDSSRCCLLMDYANESQVLAALNAMNIVPIFTIADTVATDDNGDWVPTSIST
jgi:hypothetical protein